MRTLCVIDLPEVTFGAVTYQDLLTVPIFLSVSLGIGGESSNLFVFTGGLGEDQITDFSPDNAEDIDLSGVTGITGFLGLGAQRRDGADRRRANSILLVGIGHAYSGEDFLF